MKRTLTFGLLFTAAFALLAVVNGLVFSRINANRQGEPTALLWLTERELPLNNRLEFEDTGLDLRLAWRTPTKEESGVETAPGWLTSVKLRELGFRFMDNVPVGEGENRQGVRLRPVFFVLEYNGTAYREALLRAEWKLAKEEEALRVNPSDKSVQAARAQAKKLIKAEEMTLSRLFVVDAGTEPRHLAFLYPDRARFLIAKGLVRLVTRHDNNQVRVGGIIDSISMETIHVPQEHRRPLDALKREGKQPQSETLPPRYEVQLAVGTRFEPWIEAIRPLKDK